MKIFSFIALALAAGGLCFTRASAQTTSSNAVLTAALNLTAYVQQPTNGNLPSVGTRKFATKDIIASIESDLGLPTNDLATAKLLLKFSGLGGTNDVPLDIILRTSGGDTNINNMFQLAGGNMSQLGNLTVSTVRSNTATTVSTRTDYTIVSLLLTNTTLAFQAQGQVKIDQSSVVAGKKVVESRPIPTAYTVALTGSGTVGTNSAVFSGTFSATNRKLE